MAKYLSNRSKVTPQSGLRSDRYKYLSIEDAEPNLGDPLVGPSAVSAKPIPPGQQYIIVSVEGKTGERYWIPNQGGLIPGSISVFDENSLVGGASSTTQLTFKGNAVTATGIAGPPPGIGVTITIAPPGNNTSVLFKNSGDFATDSRFTFNDGLFTAGDRITVGTGGTVITTTASGFVGINTPNPTQELDVNGDIRLRGTIYDYNNEPGTNAQILTKNNFGGIIWVNQDTVRAGAGGTYRNVQFHNSAGLVDGAENFVYNEVDNRVGIGSTIPKVLLDVLGISSFKGTTYIDNLIAGIATIQTLGVTGTTTTRNLQVTGITTLGFLTGTSAYFTGIVTASKFKGNLDVDDLYVSGISTFLKKVGISSDLGVTGLTTTKNLEVYESTKLKNLKVSGISTFDQKVNIDNNLGVTGIATIDNIKIYDNTIETIIGNLTLDSYGGTTQIDDSVYINDTTPTTSSSTGSLRVSGGVGIGLSLRVGYDVYAKNFYGTYVGVSTTANQVSTGTTTGTSSYYLTFVDSNNTNRDYESLYTDSGISYNPDTKRLSVSGAIESFNDFYNGLQEGGQLILRGKSGTNVRWNIDNYTTPSSSVLNQFRIFREDDQTGLNGRVYLGITNIGEVVITNSLGDVTPTGTSNQQLQVQSGAYVSGNLGIGITNPQSKLDVAGTIIQRTTSDLDTNGFAYISYQDNSTGTYLERGYIGFGVGDGTFNISNYAGSITFRPNNTERARFDINGNLIIGTQIPTGTASQPLQVTGGTYVSGNLGIGRTNPQVKLEVLGGASLYSPNTAAVASLSASNTGVFDITSYYATGGTMRFILADSTGNNRERVTIINSGNLGIGTVSPTSKLQVAGDVTPSVTNAYDLGTSSLKWKDVYANNFYGNYVGVASVTNQVSTGTTNGTSSYYLTFVDSNNSTRAYESLYTDSGISYNPNTNSLGIGTTNPIRGLHISNDTISSEIVMQVNSFAANRNRWNFVVDEDTASGTPTHTKFYIRQLNQEAAGGEVPFLITSKGEVLVGSDAVISIPTITGAPSPTGTPNQKLQVTGGAYVSGNLGIGITNPTSKLQVSDTSSTNIYSNQTYRTDENIPIGIGIGINYFPSYTTPGTQTSFVTANYSVITGNIIAGSTNNGYIRSGVDVALRGRTTTDNGTLSSIYGRLIEYGHWHNVPIVVNPITTNVYGLMLRGFCNNGTITNIYGINIPPIQKLEGASVINAYGIYSSIQSTDATNSAYNLYIPGSAQNYISGNLGIGTTNPTSKLQVAGDVTPSVTETYDLGTLDLKWNNVYAKTFVGAITGNANTADKLKIERNIAITGDLTWNVNFDGSSNVTSTGTLANTTVTAGTYGSSTAFPTFTVDSKGRLTSASTSNFSDITAGNATYATRAGLATDVEINGTNQILYQVSNNNTGLLPQGSSGQLLQSNGTSVPSWVSLTNLTAGNATYATNAGIATNLKGGTKGSIPYQTAVNTTAFISDPNIDGRVLTWNDTLNEPVWSENIATNLKGGAASQIPYQTAANTTEFIQNGDPGQLLQSNGTSAPTWVNPPSVGIGSTGLTVTEDNTNTTRYIGFVTTTSGISSVFANQNLTVNPSSKIVGINTNNLTNTALVGSAASARGLYISNGMIIMDNSLNSNSYIGANYNALMVGPVVVNSVITIDGNLAVV